MELCVFCVGETLISYRLIDALREHVDPRIHYFFFCHQLLTFLMNMFSRHNEYEADAFAVGLNYSTELQSALVKLNKDNLGFPVHDGLYSAWHHSHPPLLQRIQRLQAHDRKRE